MLLYAPWQCILYDILVARWGYSNGSAYVRAWAFMAVIPIKYQLKHLIKNIFRIIFSIAIALPLFVWQFLPVGGESPGFFPSFIAQQYSWLYCIIAYAFCPIATMVSLRWTKRGFFLTWNWNDNRVHTIKLIVCAEQYDFRYSFDVAIVFESTNFSSMRSGFL